MAKQVKYWFGNRRMLFAKQGLKAPVRGGKPKKTPAKMTAKEERRRPRSSGEGGGGGGGGGGDGGGGDDSSRREELKRLYDLGLGESDTDSDSASDSDSEGEMMRRGGGVDAPTASAAPASADDSSESSSVILISDDSSDEDNEPIATVMEKKKNKASSAAADNKGKKSGGAAAAAGDMKPLTRKVHDPHWASDTLLALLSEEGESLERRHHSKIVSLVWNRVKRNRLQVRRGVIDATDDPLMWRFFGDQKLTHDGNKQPLSQQILQIVLMHCRRKGEKMARVSEPGFVIRVDGDEKKRKHSDGAGAGGDDSDSDDEVGWVQVGTLSLD